jgi:tripartite-type tricarboxylate transporter receptor subunit TctC
MSFSRCSAMRTLGPALVGLALVTTPASAGDDSSGAFFRGKTVHFMTMGGPGGGFDTYMRTILPFLKEKLAATIVPMDVPGAGGLVAIDRAMNAVPDGLTVLLTGGAGLAEAQIYGLPGVHYDVRKLSWVARVTAEPVMVVVAQNGPFRSFANILKSKRSFIWGVNGKVGGTADVAAVVSYALNLNAKIVSGYHDSAEILLALERGEVDGTTWSDSSSLRTERAGKLKAVVAVNRKRSALFPNVPTIFEAVPLTAEQSWWLDWRANIEAIGRVVVATPGTPKERLRLLRAAFKSVLQDPALSKVAERRGLTIDYASADDVKKLVDNTMNRTTGARLKQIRDVVTKKYYPK